jgi:branched-chain amino acid transport system substrate-binding protein
LLAHHFGDEHVFMDIDDIPPGRNFRQVIEEALAGCDVLLALIGPRWLERGDWLRRRRLDDPDDFVRFELGVALQRGIVLLPVLVQNATMPVAAQLPRSLAALADIQAFELTDRRWGVDTQSLLTSLGDVDVATLRAERAQQQPTAMDRSVRGVPRVPANPTPTGVQPELVNPPGRRRALLVVGAALSAVLLVVAVVVAIQDSGGTEGSTGAPAGCDTSRGSLTVGLIAPLSGSFRNAGLGLRNAADLAVDQANDGCAVPGYRLILKADDDQADPRVAAEVATALAVDPSVVGVVGTLNSVTAETVQPILNEHGIVMISPANTFPLLTLGADPMSAPSRPFPTYFRLTATDLVQGPFAARYLVQKSGKRRLAVVDDGTSFGAPLAEQFAQEAQKLGAAVVIRERVGQRDTEFAGLIDKIRSATPEVVYYGGVYLAAGPLSRQLGSAGLGVPLMGGDGILYPDYIALGGRPGDLATFIGAPAETLPTASQFVADYRAANYADPSGSYGVLAYDATNLLIAAVTAAVRDGGWSDDSRAAVARKVQATNVQGASGPISFDQYGDTTNRVLTVFSVSGEVFTPVDGSTAAFVD